MDEFSFHFGNQLFRLLSSGAVYWPKHNSLIIADIHLSKSGHFRKEGIPIPGFVTDSDLQLLELSIKQTQANKCIILGDAFHSRSNSELWQVAEWIRSFQNEVKFELIQGNHDILDIDWYEKLNISLLGDSITIDEITFVHQLELENEYPYSLSGHIHPKIVLRGKGRQLVKLKCLLINDNHCILPAFGSFKGGFAITPQSSDRILALTEQEVIEIPTS